MLLSSQFTDVTQQFQISSSSQGKKMTSFHDVTIFSGAKPVTTASRLEIAAKVPFLRDVLSTQNLCDGCRENITLVFAEEDEDTLRGTFADLSLFNAGFQGKFSTFVREQMERSAPTVEEGGSSTMICTGKEI